jgi:GTP-binding protein
LPLDIQLLNCFAPQGKPVHILLTKADKLNQKERALALKTAEARLAELPQLGLVASLQFFSVLKREGLEAADRVIYRWMQGEVAAGIEEQRQNLPSTAAH